MGGRPRPKVAPDRYKPAGRGRHAVARPHPVAAWFVLLALRALARLPFPAIYGVAGALGWIVARLPVRPVRFAAITIRLCFPKLGERECQTLVRRSTVASARAMCEIGAFCTWPRDRVLGLVREVAGLDVLEAAVAAGRGVILAGPHLGAWELVNLYCSSRYPFAALYRRPGEAALDRFLVQGRTRFGARLVPGTPGGLRTLVRALANREIVFLMPDQDPRRGAGVFVPFFGVLANTTTLVSRLANRSGARVILGFAERLPEGAGFRLHFRRASAAVYDADLLTSVTALNADIERLVCDCPEQYVWSYRRFRNRPRGELDPYKRSAHAETPAH
jgi:Kdo2-lipid IVA lauroyltransferase/acyltransferase